MSETAGEPAGTQARDRAIVRESGRFDATFYAENYQELFSAGEEPLEHFLRAGHARGLMPAADFDPLLYKLAYSRRGHENSLLDAILRGDGAAHRDAAPLAQELQVAAQPLGLMLYKQEHRARFTANAHEIAQNVARSVHVPWQGDSWELRNPHPDLVLARLAEDKPLVYCRYTQGLWDCLLKVREVVARLRADARFREFAEAELRSLAVRLLASAYPEHGVFVENFLDEIEADLATNPVGEDFWSAIAFKGFPTHDETPLGYEHEGLKDRVAIFAEYFAPRQTVYDATMWKRWVLSGDMPRFVDTVRRFPVVLVGPQKFATLGEKWRIDRYTHVVIPPAKTQQIRHRVLAGMLELLGSLLSAGGARPIVLFQCGSLSPWLIRRLHRRLPAVSYIDIGQALDTWYWNPDVLWMKVYRDAIVAANPSAQPVESERQPRRPGWAPGARKQ
jgi:hypothetical protein